MERWGFGQHNPSDGHGASGKTTDRCPSCLSVCLSCVCVCVYVCGCVCVCVFVCVVCLYLYMGVHMRAWYRCRENPTIWSVNNSRCKISSVQSTWSVSVLNTSHSHT